MIGSGVIVPAQTSPEEMEVMSKVKTNAYEEKLFYRECESFSSNWIYQIQKVSEENEKLVGQGMIFFDNFRYYENELRFKANSNVSFS